MLTITAPLAPTGLIAILYLGILFNTLSKRLNAVAKKRDLYRWFNVANVLVVIAAASQLIRNTAALAKADYSLPFLLEPWFALISFHIPLAVGVTLDLALVWYYWGWILKEKADNSL